VTLAGSDFDTLLAVYTGAAVNALTRVANNDDCNTSVSTSCVTFNVVPGTNYSVQVDGSLAKRGTVRIAVTFGWATPANDAFSTPFSPWQSSGKGTTLGATLESWEPLAGSGASGSVWYRFTAEVNGIARVRVWGPVANPVPEINDSLHALLRLPTGTTYM
jgi:hypothetical protein